jgi:tetratricopeptide (TPR) repeat protein
MAKKKSDDVLDDLNVTEKISSAEGFIVENKKSIGIISSAVLVIILLYFGYTNLIVGPQEQDAQREMFMAQKYFETDSIEKAINGDGQYPGFIEIIDTYGSSPSANLAHYYLGMCYMKKAQWEDAIDNLKGYDAEDAITGALALGAIGDANLELDNRDEALSYYNKAINWNSNYFTAPIFMMKAALVHELAGDYKAAAGFYERIKNDFPESAEAKEIERYIVRANSMASKSN